MEIPSFNLTQTDGALTSLPDEEVHAKIGTCSAGPLNTPTLVASKTALVSTFGAGKLVEDTAYQLDVARRPVLVVRANGGAAGSIGGVVRSGGGSASLTLTGAGGNHGSAPVPTLTGTPVANFAFRLRISQAGANLAASPRFQYSLDGGLTYSDAAVALAGPTALGSTGLSLAWADGVFVANNSWSGEVVAADQQGSAALAVSGTPTDAFHVVLEVVRRGTSLGANTATYRASLDGGRVFGPEMAMPVGGIVALTNTGLTLTFTDGASPTFEEDDVFEFRTTAPGATLSDLQNAWNAMQAAPYDVEGVHITSTADDTIAAGVDALAASAIAVKKPRWVLMEARDLRADETEAAWITSLQTAFSGFVSTLGRVLVAAGALDLVSTLSGRQRRVNVGVVAAARAAAVPYSEDLAWVGRGALPGVQRLHHDEDAVPGLNIARFVTARRHEGIVGFFLTNPVTMAAPGSDFELLQYRRVWDRAYRVVRRVFTPALSQDFITNPADVQAPLVPGAIDEVEAADLEERGKDALSDALLRSRPRHATAVDVSVDRLTTFTVTRELLVDFAVTPKGYAKRISGTLGFINPARVAS